MATRFLAILLFGLIAFYTSQLAGDSPAPPHRPLWPPQQASKDARPPVWHPRQGALPATAPYAYGWFGAKSRRQWTRHFGYYQRFTQWSSR